LIVEENTSRNNWPLARVIEVLPGADGLVRKAKVKAKNTEYLRPINKLVLLLATSDKES